MEPMEALTPKSTAPPSTTRGSIMMNEESESSAEFRIRREGLTKGGYFFGIIFVGACVFVLGRWPYYSWLLLLGGDVFLPFVWYYHVTRYRRGNWFITDICWLATLCRVVYFVLVWNNMLDDAYLEIGFRAVFMASAGYLSCCVIPMDNSLVFYSFERLTNLWVHMMPVVVLLVIREENGFIPELMGEHGCCSWRFPLQVWPETRLTDLFFAAMVPYFLWLVPYAIWLMVKGVNLPEEGFATAFSENYLRRFKDWVTERFGVAELKTHAIVYLVGHFVLVSLTFAFALLSWYSYIFHSVWVVIIMTYSLLSGSNHYITISVKKFGPIIKREDEEKELRAKALKAERMRQSLKGTEMAPAV